jgi:arylformamidase
LVPVIDISLPIKPDMLLYPGDHPPQLRRLLSLELGDLLTASELLIGCHVGTHVDAPAHFCRGAVTVDQLNIRHFVGPAIVVEVPGTNRIGAADLVKSAIPSNHHVLIKTDNSMHLHTSEFRPQHCYLAPEAVHYVLSFDPLSIGFDYYSLDPPSESAFPAHTLVANRGLPVFVCLDLSTVCAGRYEFIATPIPLKGAEGMPVRALLRETAPEQLE